MQFDADKAAKTVAILGAGPGGLCAAKAMLAAGLRPTVFDKAASIGGMWDSNSHQLWSSMRTNLSHFTCRYSDFLWDSDTPTFPSQKQVGTYLGQYTQAFIPPECFRLGNEVTLVSRSGSGGPCAQQWEVQWRSAAAAAPASATFDHVVVSTGFYSQPHAPLLPNQAAFQGEVLHSSGYCDAAHLAGRRVAVVGGGHSGVEIASDLARLGAQVTHIMPQPLWVAPRLLPLDAASSSTPFLPLDLVFYRRSRRKQPPPQQQQQQQLPRSPEDNRKAHEGLRTLLGSSSLVPSPLPPPWSLDQVLDRPPQLCISDSYLGSYRNGSITAVLGRVEDVRESSLLVRASGPGGPGPLVSVDDLSAVVLCTGFKPKLGFMQPQLLEEMGYDAGDIFSPLLLHRNVFHPAAPGLAMVGMYRAPYFGVMELQAKWAAAVFSGALESPPAHVQQQGIELEAAIKAQRPRPQFPHADYIGLADELAAMLPAPATDSTHPATASTSAAAPALPASDLADEIAADVVLPGCFHGVVAAAAAAAGVQPVVAAALRGRGVAAAIFRSLAGPWTLTRRITSALPSSPSGSVNGEASFTPTTAASASASDEWLYSEQGTFTLGGGQQMRVWRKYVYTYDSAEDRLSLFFAEGDGRGLPFMTLTLHPSGPADDTSAAPAEGGVASGLVSCPISARAGEGGEGAVSGAAGEAAGPECSGCGGWVATGDHLCGRDMYRSTFRFVFSGTELSEVHQRVSVKGPEKDYVADSSYTRSGAGSSPSSGSVSSAP